jgi:hypothetical protein
VRALGDSAHRWHAQHGISYVTANLIALKEPMERNGGTYLPKM